jgi:hypothetical protein
LARYNAKRSFDALVFFVSTLPRVGLVLAGISHAGA